MMAGAVPGAKVALPFMDCNKASIIFLLKRVKLTLDIDDRERKEVA